MKKLIYILILVTMTSLSLSSCTEQEIKPTAGGGNVSDPK
ncbi:hypothetical protein BH09BAC3_BH09BAC3_07890 [soil metagenome]